MYRVYVRSVPETDWREYGSLEIENHGTIDYKATSLQNKTIAEVKLLLKLSLFVFEFSSKQKLQADAPTSPLLKCLQHRSVQVSDGSTMCWSKDENFNIMCFFGKFIHIQTCTRYILIFFHIFYKRQQHVCYYERQKKKTAGLRSTITGGWFVCITSSERNEMIFYILATDAIAITNAASLA